MSKIACSALLVSLILLAAGCGPGIKEEFTTDYDTEKTITPSLMPAKQAEVERVEQMALYRNSYGAALEGLIEYYSMMGDHTKLSWARDELKSFKKMNKYTYITIAVLNKDLKAVDLIIEADELYAEAAKLYKDAHLLMVVVDEGKLRLALSKFNDLIVKYPTSDKIDDAAYRAGRIHDHLKNYRLAAEYYECAFLWNEHIRYPARSRAAYIYDHRLNDKEKALELWRQAYQYEKHYPKNIETAVERINELAPPEYKIENDSTAVPGDGVNIQDDDLK